MTPDRTAKSKDQHDLGNDSDVPGRLERSTSILNATDAASEAELHHTQLEVALYIENISSELRLMARAAGLDALAYFLEMARIEASIQVEKQALKMKD